jgi:hypothetical protein
MTALEEVCRSLTARLERSGETVEATSALLAHFEKEANYLPTTLIEIRLWTVELEVGIEAVQQFLNHKGKGIVCIMTVHDGKLFVTWYEDDSILTVAKKSWAASLTTLTSGELFAFINHLLQHLHNGDWEPVVKWLQAHGKSVGPI